MSPLSDPESDPASHTDAAGPGAPRHPVRSLMTRSALTGGITELALVGAHVLMYPLGTRTDPLRVDPRCRPGDQPPDVRALFAADPLAARVPVVLVHGLVDNHSIFAVMRRSLRRRGFAQVCSWNYSPRLRDVESAAAALGRHVERVCHQTGHDRVHVVGQSWGGRLGADPHSAAAVGARRGRSSGRRTARSSAAGAGAAEGGGSPGATEGAASGQPGGAGGGDVIDAEVVEEDKR